jgi:hypothetical protein
LEVFDHFVNVSWKGDNTIHLKIRNLSCKC